jgi:hypothetical protein
MKKLILSVTAIAGFSMATFAQGTITFDGSNNATPGVGAASGGLVYLAGVLDTTTDINAELLYSSTIGGTYSPVVTLSLLSSAGGGSAALGQTLAASGDITAYGTGQFYDNSGQAFILPIAAGATAFFEVQGNVTVNGTTYTGQTAAFAEVLSSASSPSQTGVDAMPALNLVSVPEPSTLAMAGVGMASMLFLRRKNK